MTPSTEAETWDWPDSLDALVAAPEFHSLLLENDNLRVLDTEQRCGRIRFHLTRWKTSVPSRFGFSPSR